MSLATHDAPVSSKRLWAGRIISALPALLLLFSGTMKLLKVPAVIEGMAHYGYPEHLILYNECASGRSVLHRTGSGRGVRLGRLVLAR
jgi:hypothetical protein